MHRAAGAGIELFERGRADRGRRRTGCDAVYPGYGFLSEKSAFAADCSKKEQLTFIGPSPEVIRAMGDKVEARRIAARNGVPIVPGSPECPMPKRRQRLGDRLPATAEGSGRRWSAGDQIAGSMDEFDALFAQASAEAAAAFGNREISLERFFRK